MGGGVNGGRHGTGWWSSKNEAENCPTSSNPLLGESPKLLRADTPTLAHLPRAARASPGDGGTRNGGRLAGGHGGLASDVRYHFYAADACGRGAQVCGERLGIPLRRKARMEVKIQLMGPLRPPTKGVLGSPLRLPLGQVGLGGGGFSCSTSHVFRGGLSGRKSPATPDECKQHRQWRSHGGLYL